MVCSCKVRSASPKQRGEGREKGAEGGAAPQNVGCGGGSFQAFLLQFVLVCGIGHRAWMQLQIRIPAGGLQIPPTTSTITCRRRTIYEAAQPNAGVFLLVLPTKCVGAHVLVLLTA